MVGLNKTKTRNSLGLDRTLSSIMMVKMTGLEPQCFKWESPTLVIKTSKCATKKNIHKLKCALSLSHTHTHTPHTHQPCLTYICRASSAILLYVYSMYIEHCSSVGSFVAKFIFIFDTFAFLKYINLFILFG